MKNVNLKKFLLLNLPYLLVGLYATKLGQAWRLAAGADASEKLLHLMDGFASAFQSALPSFYPTDLLIGLACGAAFRLAVYLKGKDAKKYRHGQEYGSARWGTAADIAPYIDPVFQNNVILTQTERLMMSSRPKDPKTARNKNVLIIGGSGSGKTRFWLKPNLMQCHSSYVVTDPKGSILVECGKLLQRNNYRKMLLTVPIVQETFTLQDIGTTYTDDVEIVSIKRGGQNAPYTGTNSGTGEIYNYEDRIIEVTFWLKNESGLYRFDQCHQYPTLLEKDQHWGMYLAVDFDSKVLYESYEKTYEDAANGIKATLNVDASSGVSAQLKNAEMRVQTLTETTEGEDYKVLRTVLLQRYKTVPDSAELYCLTFWCDGQKIELNDGVTLENVCFTGRTSGATVMYSSGNVLGTAGVESTNEGLKAAVGTTTNLLAVVEETSEIKESVWPLTYSKKDNATGIVQIISTEKSDSATDASAGNIKAGVSENDNMNETALSLVKQTSSFENPEILHVYGMSLEVVNDYPNAIVPLYTSTGPLTSQGFPVGLNNSGVSQGYAWALFPETDANTEVYVLSGLKSGSYKLREVKVQSVGNGMISAELVPADYKRSDDEIAGQKRTNNVFSGFWNALMASRGIDADKTYTLRNGVDVSTKTSSETRFDYVVLAREAPTYIDKPEAVDQTYDGTVKTGVPAGTGYTVTGNTETEVGTYLATVKLLDGYEWSDHTTADLNLVWSIEEKSVDPVTPVTPVTPSKNQTYKNVTANLYVPGSLNSVLGVNAYLTNKNTPITTGTAPTEPVSNNVSRMTVDSDGTATLTISIPNPVFTLQEIGGCKNATVTDYQTSSNLKFQGSAPSGAPDSRISSITVELEDFEFGKVYKFTDCEEYPTLLNQTWTVDLYLVVEEEGSELESTNPENVNVNNIISGATGDTTLEPEAKVSGDKATASVTQSQMNKVIETAANNDKEKITIAPDETDGAGTIIVKVPKASLKTMASDTDADLVIKTENGSVQFNNKALGDLAADAKGSTVDITIQKLDKEDVAGSVTDDLTNASVVKVSVASGGTELKNFGGKSAEVIIPVDKNAFTAGNSCRVLAIYDDGTQEYLTGTCAKKGSGLIVTADAEKPGTFVVLNERSASFTDVPDSAYYRDAVNWAVSKGITSGTSETTFGPDASCTRAQMVTFLWRAAGAPEPSGTNQFSDVTESDYYYKAVLWAAEQGITTGTGDGQFSPNAAVTRAQTMTFIWRANGTPGTGTGTFSDVASDAYYAQAVAWGVDQGITTGTGDSQFSPDANCTRAQIVTFLCRAYA